MGFQLKVGDRVVYCHAFEFGEDIYIYSCGPVTKILQPERPGQLPLAVAFCPLVEKIANPVEFKFFILDSKLLRLVLPVITKREAVVRP